MALPGRWLFAMTWRGKWPPSAAETPCPPAGAKGDRTPMVSCPLLTPLTFLWTRLPAVARLNARGPQGRLVLQGPTLDGSEAFRSRTLPPCTVWPRTDSATDNAREIQGLTASQNLPDARNRAPFLPFRRATAGSRGAKEGLGESRGGKGTIRCPCPLLSPPPDGGNARSAHRQPSLACGGKPPERRNRFPSVEGKTKMASAPGREHFFHSPEGFSAMR